MRPDPLSGTLIGLGLALLGTFLAGSFIYLPPVFAVVWLIEELAFRGWVQQSVGRRLGATAGIATSAILFTVFHVWYSHPEALLVPLVLGVVFGVAVHVSRSLWKGVLLHGTWNGTLMLLESTGIDATAFFSWPDPAVGLSIAVLTALGGAGLFAWSCAALAVAARCA